MTVILESSDAMDRICGEPDNTPGIWLVRDMLAEGGLTVQSDVMLEGRPVTYARTVVTLDADVVTSFRADAARDETLVAAHYDRVRHKVERLGEMRSAIRWAAGYAGVGGAAISGFLSEGAASSFAPDWSWLVTATALTGGAVAAPIAVKTLLHRLVRKLKQLT